MFYGIVLWTDLSLDNYLTPIFALLLSIWVIVTVESWKRRETEHAFIWNTLNYKENELVREEYTGDYAIDPNDKNISINNSFSTAKRRMLVS